MKQWLSKRGMSSDSLQVVAQLDEATVTKVMGLNRVAPGRTGSTTKAEAARLAASRLGALGIDSAADLRSFVAEEEDGAERILRCYTSVYGLGKVTGEYFLMLLGVPGVKADRMVNRFVERAIGRPVEPSEARALVVRVHDSLAESALSGVSLIELDHAIWLHERSREV